MFLHILLSWLLFQGKRYEEIIAHVFSSTKKVIVRRRCLEDSVKNSRISGATQMEGVEAVGSFEERCPGAKQNESSSCY